MTVGIFERQIFIYTDMKIVLRYLGYLDKIPLLGRLFEALESPGRGHTLLR